MAWTTPRTWTAGETVTAALMNTHVRDNTAFLKAIADNFAPVPACRVYRTNTQSIPNNTWTAISFGLEEFDTDTMHSSITNPERITIRTAGIYQIFGTVSFDPNATGVRAACITHNGSTVPDDGIVFCSQSGNATANHLPPLSVLKSCAATDILRFYVFQNSGGALDVSVSTITPFFSAVYQGSAS